MVGARKRAVRNAVAVNVGIALEAAELCRSSALSTLPRSNFFVGYLNGSDIQLFMPRSRSLITKMGVWNRSARSKAS